MYRRVFIDDFSRLGLLIESHLNGVGVELALSEATKESYKTNELFSELVQKEALKAIYSNFLDRELLENWLLPYSHLLEEKHERVLIVMAGNIPLVGFHDLLSVLAAGYKVAVKLSSKDRYLLPALIDILIGIREFWRDRIEFIDELLPNERYVIATGSDSTASFFNSLYRNSRRVIRGGKNSIAILHGGESERQIEELAKDIALYHGMGCRSVSTLLLPTGYKIENLIRSLSNYCSKWLEAKSYFDNYRYNRALLTMKEERFWDSGNMLFWKDAPFSPPLAVVGVKFWSSKEELERVIDSWKDKLQCVVNFEFRGEHIQFGESQAPSLLSWADGVNILDYFLKND